MSDAERCAQFLDWMRIDAETSTEDDFYRRVADAMREGKNVAQFVMEMKAFRPEVDWPDAPAP